MRHGMAWALRVALLVVCAVLAGIAPVAASEPDGAVLFRAAWADDDRSARDDELHGSGAELRLQFESYADLRDVVVEFLLDGGLDVGLLDAEALDRAFREARPDGTARLRLEVGDLARRRPGSVRLNCRILEGRGAILRVEIRGTGPDGREVRDAFGVPVGSPGGARLRRHGAIEYRAVPVDPPDAGGADR